MDCDPGPPCSVDSDLNLSTFRFSCDRGDIVTDVKFFVGNQECTVTPFGSHSDMTCGANTLIICAKEDCGLTFNARGMR